MKAKQRAKQNRAKQNIIFKVALAIFLAWIFISLLQLQLEINNKRTVLAELDTQIVNQQRTNDELQSDVDNNELYLELQAHDRGFAKSGETIYKEVPGST
ncbi:MAG: septum formation initiator family protein [Clostridia bacterium]|nr:septum formation initiator family protein [Clostridia bacterium]